MYSLKDQLEFRRMTISGLLSCIYLSSIVIVVSYKGLLYSVGKGSSFYILVLIFAAELLKSFYLKSGNEVQAKKSKPSKNRASDIIKSLMLMLGAIFCFFVGIILFGAPVLDCHEETLMLSALMTLLIMFPLIAHTGVEASIQLLFGQKSYRSDSIIDMLIMNARLTVCGAWLGTLLISLDWNKPWQQWPIPSYFGAIGGYLLSNVLIVIKVTLMNAAQKYPKLNILVNIMNKFQICE